MHTNHDTAVHTHIHNYMEYMQNMIVEVSIMHNNPLHIKGGKNEEARTDGRCNEDAKYFGPLHGPTGTLQK